jgi:hypothetical protein
MPDNLYQIGITIFILSWAMLALYAIIYGIQRSVRPSNPLDGYDVVDQASAIVARCWLEDDGTGVPVN